MTKYVPDRGSYLAGVYSTGLEPAPGVEPSTPCPRLLIDTAEVSRITRLSQQTLIQGRSTGAIPLNYVKLGRRVFYRWEDVERFINDHVVVCGGVA